MKNILFSAAIILAGLVSNAQTSTATATQTVTLVLKNAISINITSATGTSFSFDDANEYSTGLTNTSASTIQVASNLPWAVSVKTSTANFSGPAAPAATMPSSALGVRLNGGSAFTSLSTSAASLTSGARGTGSFSVDYKANPGYAYDAGTYTISVVYTATQQ
jgi:hypothetical protein